MCRPAGRELRVGWGLTVEMGWGSELKVGGLESAEGTRVDTACDKSRAGKGRQMGKREASP